MTRPVVTWRIANRYEQLRRLNLSPCILVEIPGQEAGGMSETTEAAAPTRHTRISQGFRDNFRQILF